MVLEPEAKDDMKEPREAERAPFSGKHASALTLDDIFEDARHAQRGHGSPYLDDADFDAAVPY